MPVARLIVCEKQGHWARAMRCLLPQTPANRGGQAQVLRPLLRVYETRSLQECWEEVAHSPASFVTIEATSKNCEAVLEFLAQLVRRYLDARAVVLGERGLKPQQWLLREAGAIHVVFSPRQLEPVLRMAERRLAMFDQKPQNLIDEIHDRLPWSK